MKPIHGLFLTGEHLQSYLKLRDDVEKLESNGHYIKFDDPIFQEYIQFVKSLPAFWHLELRKKAGVHLGTHRFLASASEFINKHCEETFHNDKKNEFVWIAELKVFYDNNQKGLSKLDDALVDWYPSDFGAICIEGTIPDVTYKIYPLTRETMLEIILACFEPCLAKSERDTKTINPKTSFWSEKNLK